MQQRIQVYFVLELSASSHIQYQLPSPESNSQCNLTFQFFWICLKVLLMAGSRTRGESIVARVFLRDVRRMLAWEAEPISLVIFSR